MHFCSKTSWTSLNTRNNISGIWKEIEKLQLDTSTGTSESVEDQRRITPANIQLLQTLISELIQECLTWGRTWLICFRSLSAYGPDIPEQLLSSGLWLWSMIQTPMIQSGIWKKTQPTVLKTENILATIKQLNNVKGYTCTRKYHKYDPDLNVLYSDADRGNAGMSFGFSKAQ